MCSLMCGLWAWYLYVVCCVQYFITRIKFDFLTPFSTVVPILLLIPCSYCTKHARFHIPWPVSLSLSSASLFCRMFIFIISAFSFLTLIAIIPNHYAVILQPTITITPIYFIRYIQHSVNHFWSDIYAIYPATHFW